MNKSLLSIVTLSFLTLSCQSDYEPGIRSYQSVGDWGYMIDSIDITVPDKSVLKGLEAQDFGLTGNTYGTPYDPSTG